MQSVAHTIIPFFVESDLLILILGKLNLFRLTGLKTPVLLMWKWTEEQDFFLRKNILLKSLAFLSLLNWIKVVTFYEFFFLLGSLCISINLPYDLTYSRGKYTDVIILLSPFVDVLRTSMSTVFFLSQVISGILCLYKAFLWPLT